MVSYFHFSLRPHAACLPAQPKAGGLIVCFVLRTPRICVSAKPGLAHFIFLSLLCEIHQLIKVSCGCCRHSPPPTHRGPDNTRRNIKSFLLTALNPMTITSDRFLNHCISFSIWSRGAGGLPAGFFSLAGTNRPLKPC